MFVGQVGKKFGLFHLRQYNCDPVYSLSLVGSNLILTLYVGCRVQISDGLELLEHS